MQSRSWNVRTLALAAVTKPPYNLERFCTVIRKHARLGAKDILNAVYADIKAFTLGARQEDESPWWSPR